VKNRYGPTDEVGCFRLDGDGLADLPDPSGLFLSRAHGLPGGEPIAPPGTCVTVTLEGRRPLVAEVQALVAPPAGAHPRRAVSGLDPARLSMVLAVVETRLDVKLAINDVYASTVGGVRITEPAADLASALAVWSVARRVPLPADLIALGEVGLSGDLRPCHGIERRLQAAARLGFRRAIVPAGYASSKISVPDSMVVAEAGDLSEVVAALRRFLAEPARVRGHSPSAGSRAGDPDQLAAQVLALRPA
jgi:DNA repair protein RadA/Sms